MVDKSNKKKKGKKKKRKRDKLVERFRPRSTDLNQKEISCKMMKGKLIEWVKSGILPSTISDLIIPIGSIHLRLYGLSKNHKDGIPLRLILYMIGSSLHKVI